MIMRWSGKTLWVINLIFHTFLPKGFKKIIFSLVRENDSSHETKCNNTIMKRASQIFFGLFRKELGHSYVWHINELFYSQYPTVVQMGPMPVTSDFNSNAINFMGLPASSGFLIICRFYYRELFSRSPPAILSFNTWFFFALIYSGCCWRLVSILCFSNLLLTYICPSI